jgi:hypothetical protein
MRQTDIELCPGSGSSGGRRLPLDAEKARKSSNRLLYAAPQRRQTIKAIPF